MKKFIVLIIIAILGIGLVLMSRKKSNRPQGIEISKNRYPVLGIDLSEYSGSVRFEDLVKEKQIDFIYLRASAGKDHKDEKFENNYLEAIRNKFVVGYYHYYRFYEDPKTQAEFFLKQIHSKESTLPIVVDVEEWGNKKDNKSTMQISKEIKVFVDIIKSRIGKDVMIYTNESGYNSYVKNKIENIPIWICSFSRKSKVDDKWLFWQYSHKGKLNSIEGWVDLNTFNGDRDKWNKFLNR